MVTCPACSNCQEESPLAVSTFCKKCNTHLKIEKGVVSAPEQATGPAFLNKKKDSPKKEEELENEKNVAPLKSSKGADASRPKTPPQPESKKTEPKKTQSAPAPAQASQTKPHVPTGRSKPKLPPRPKPPLLQEQQRKPNPEALKKSPASQVHASSSPLKHEASKGSKSLPKIAPEPLEEVEPKEEVPVVIREAGPDDRMVKCFDCEVEHPTSKNSTSALCPKCGTYISLKDFLIKENFNSRIQTRGHVFIHKRGVVSSSIIQCHSLTVEGEFTGAAECSGELIIRRHSQIEGEVKCHRLLIEKRAKVTFAKGVVTDSCEIDGTVEGDIVCRGRLELHKKASLQGDIKVGTLSVDAGAKHHGQISMGSF